MTSLRVFFLLACAALVVCAVKFESHEVASLAGTSKSDKSEKTEKTENPAKPGRSALPVFETVSINGLEFTEASSVDGFLLKEGVLFDVYSLKPVSSQTDAKLDVEKKCPT